MNSENKVFAFIDVQNTETTALKLLNFVFDWQKLINYLETRWGCGKIFRELFKKMYKFRQKEKAAKRDFFEGISTY